MPHKAVYTLDLYLSCVHMLKDATISFKTISSFSFGNYSGVVVITDLQSIFWSVLEAESACYLMLNSGRLTS
jgi:hypothetical protein